MLFAAGWLCILIVCSAVGPFGPKQGKAALEVIVQDGESLERALRKFKRKVQRSGLYSELRKRRFYEKPSAQKKRKREAAIRRERRRQRRDVRPRAA